MARTSAQVIRLPLAENRCGQGLALTSLALMGLGIVTVHSALASVRTTNAAWYARMDVRGTVFAVLAVVVMLSAWRLDYRKLVGRRRVPLWPAVLLGVALVAAGMVFVPGVGYSVGGCKRWIRLLSKPYSIGFQPSELVKLTLVIFLSAWLSRPTTDRRSFTRTFLPAVAVIVGCAGLVITQDFGTAAVIAVSAGVTLLLAGVPLIYLLGLAAAAGGSIAAMIRYDPRRWARVMAMVDPFTNSAPTADQPRQSLVSILTGGMFGKGLGRGINKLGYLPEDSTDFIFATYCEEWGLVGAVLLMSLVLIWLLNAHNAAVRSEDSFGRVLAGSLGFLIGLQMVLHIAVALVAAPPTGVSLPFVSAGGTALVITSAAAALIISISSRHSASVRA